MSATVRDVAKRAGVSAMTVSRVVNKQPGVSPKTRERIERAIADLDFAPNRIASGLTSAKSQTLGLIVPDVANPFFAPIVRGAEGAARRGGYRVLLCNSESDLRLEQNYVSDLLSHRVEGLLVAPAGDRSRPHLAKLVERGVPIVLVDRRVAGLDCDSVTLDNQNSARELTSHLVRVGHRRIALVADADDVSTGRDRTSGYRSGLEEAGIEFDEDLVFRTSTDQSGGYRVAQQILRSSQKPTAIFAVNNMTALGIFQALREAGVAIPDDIALACFDDVLHLAVIAPFLTVIAQPADLMGATAAQLLLERISGVAGRQPRQVVLQGELIVRESCGVNRFTAGAPPSHTK